MTRLHLAGHPVDAAAAGAPLLIDGHGAMVADPAWAVYGPGSHR